jgi:hypothetical protein
MSSSHIGASSGQYIGNYIFCIARSSEIMVPNNSWGTSTKITTHLARWYVLPNTYQYNKIVPKNISFCKYWASSGQYIIGNYIVT